MANAVTRYTDTAGYPVRTAHRFSTLNQLSGRIAVISEGIVNVELVILLTTGESVVATVGVSAFNKMDSGLNTPVTAMIREHAILLSTEICSPALSTRNRLLGQVVSVELGLVNAEVTLRICDHTLMMVNVGHDEIALLDCKAGDRLWANFRASDVLLATARG